MLSKREARQILHPLAATGTPAEFGLEHYTVGLDPFLRVIDEEYLSDYIRMGGSAFKLVVGTYGGGKTHFLYVVRNLAWRRGYATSYVPLSPTECPFNRLDLVYRSIMANLAPPYDPEHAPTAYHRGIDAFLHHWFATKRTLLDSEEKLKAYLEGITGLESTSFARAVRLAFEALYREEMETYELAAQWLKGEDLDREARNRLGITERLDRTTALRMLRSLAQWIRSIGYTGLVLLFDEAERGLSIASSREKRAALDNLRQIIDETGNVRFPGVMIFYAVPDVRALLDERLESYEALRQRLTGALNTTNPSGVRIDLEHLGMDPLTFLVELGQKLARLYETAYEFQFDPSVLEKTLHLFAQEAIQFRHADIGYRRVFVKGILQAFHRLRQEGQRTPSRTEVHQMLMDEVQALESQAEEEADLEEY